MSSKRVRLPNLATMVVVSALFGCSGTSDPIIPPPPSEFDVSVVVEGTVLDVTAQPVFGVTVRISVYRFEVGAGCTTQLVGPPATAIVTEEGDFARTVVYTVQDADIDYVEACITVEALPPSGYLGDSRSNLRAQLKRLLSGVEVVGGVDLVLEQDPA